MPKTIDDRLAPLAGPTHAILRIGAGLLFMLALAAAGCASGPGAGAPPVAVPNEPTAPARTPAPWSGATLDRAAVPAVYTTEWTMAENRAQCALLAPIAVDRPTATARRATFSGGWGVAYDMPELRSAFGVAGTGASAGGDTYDGWPHELEWADGSRAGYGPEGGSGPNQLAYLTIPGQECLYNVWSRLGVEHLEWLLGQLRFVEP